MKKILGILSAIIAIIMLSSLFSAQTSLSTETNAIAAEGEQGPGQ